MSTTVVFSAYAGSVVLALLLLYLFHARWYWHVLSVAVALFIGLIPTPDPLVGKRIYDLIVGCLFAFLITWGLGEIFMHRHHRR